MALVRPEHPNPAARRPRLAVLLLLAFFALQLLVFLAFRAVRPPPAPVSVSTTAVPVLASAPTRRDENDSRCGGGLVYVYDLPKAFNEDLLGMCDALAPMYSLCPYLANDGLGFPAGGTNLSSLLPRQLLGSWYASDQFALEHIVHRRLLSHRCRTTDPGRAAAFFVPFYAGLAVGRHLWAANATASDRDRDCVALLSWLHAQPWYQRSHGWDHFIALGRITWDFRRTTDAGWGGSFLTMPGWPTSPASSSSATPGTAWTSASRTRPGSTRAPLPTLFAFAGAPRSAIKGDFRALLLEECQAAGAAACGALDCAEGRCIKNNALVMELFMGARFCLQPRGDSFTRRSLFDCLVAGAVPVLFWRRSAYRQYGWYLPVDGREGEWSVFIDRDQLRAGNLTVRGVLAAIPESRARLMRKRVVK
ncbi:unnamed protein product [Miscanthus lutarioriparius]|uniref:Exostosin GT47 domain-containing protein n=1 Tax=Miscanthus lutarioriparius TaxID=422564 RepID=A0A811QTW9_9POAL|nr:unnamed protein product [Miscanthus lutarioriparius]